MVEEIILEALFSVHPAFHSDPSVIPLPSGGPSGSVRCSPSGNLANVPLVIPPVSKPFGPDSIS